MRGSQYTTGFLFLPDWKSPSTSRLKAESARLATRTLQSDNDEALVLEQQQNDLCKIAIKRFQLPKIEKCNYLGQVIGLPLPRIATAPCSRVLAPVCACSENPRHLSVTELLNC